MELERQYNLINAFFKTTTEPYDELAWDGEILEVILADVTIETYRFAELKVLIPYL